MTVTLSLALMGPGAFLTPLTLALSSPGGNSTGGVAMPDSWSYIVQREGSPHAKQKTSKEQQPKTFNMMSQQSALSNMFADDPFFSQDRLLWPLRTEALSSIQQDFFNRRSKLADSLFMELHDGPHLPLMSSAFPRLSNGDQHRDLSCTGPHKEDQQSSEENGDLLVTLDARGYAPSDITVKLEGRSLAVAALKQAGAEESQSCSSSTSRAAFKSAAAARMGFMQRIEMPPHLDLSGLSCSLMDNGQLRIHAPAAKKQPIAEEEEVPVRFRSSLEFPIKKNTSEDQATD